MAVFNRGIWKGLKGIIPLGGHIVPNSILGDSLLWKNAQKNEMKKNTSDTMNRIIPQRSPIVTGKVCNPWNVPSREISRHHWYMVSRVIVSPRVIREVLYWWNHLTSPDTMVIAPMAPVRGHGL
jgi:hypothetical protein